jgi:hypothetical protein
LKLHYQGFGVLLVTILMLAGCSTTEVTSPEDISSPPSDDSFETSNGNPEDANSTSDTSDSQSSSTDSNSDTNGNTTSSQSSESGASSNDTPSEVQKKSYESKEKATQAIENYRRLEQTNTDLGHGIQAFVEGAAGHQYISWNEGRWLIQIDFPSDPIYAYEPYTDGIDLAKKLVDYLETHYLPAPEDKGIISIRCFKDSPQTLIQWQKETDVYQITSKNGLPLETIEQTVEFGKSERPAE